MPTNNNENLLVATVNTALERGLITFDAIVDERT
jgi:hypothetical protein